MSGKWTPGPWTINLPDDEYNTPVVLDNDMNNICDTWPPDHIVSPVPMKGIAARNARLIAAAPELAEALEAMVERFGHDIFTMTPEDRELLTRAAAALAKAMGEGA